MSTEDEEKAREVAGQATWLELARKRREEVQAGRVSLVDGQEALARVRGRIDAWEPPEGGG